MKNTAINSNQLFAVVDIETTGGKLSESKMTELAICISDGTKIIDQYTTLVNPERPIDKYVVKLTGINDKMVENAPKFDSISDKIKELLNDKVFVAHNASFDYSILRKEFFELNQPFTVKTLCTVKASRKIIPGLSSYNLGSICKYLDINLENAHRALDDTIATTHLFHELVDRSKGDLLDIELKEQNYEYNIPDNWVVKSEILPKSGVIYILDSDENFIHISSEKNVKKKIYELLNPNAKDANYAQKVVENTKFIQVMYEKIKVKAELMALNEIQIFKPRYTKPFKILKPQYSLLLKADDKGLYYITQEKYTPELSSDISPLINVSTVRSGEKLKKRIQHTGPFAKLMPKRAKLLKEKGLSQKQKDEFNKEFKEKFTDHCSVGFKDGYIIYDYTDEYVGEGLLIKDFYIQSWGKIYLKENDVPEFSAEFDFVQNQKLTRSFKSITTKTSFKEIVINP